MLFSIFFFISSIISFLNNIIFDIFFFKKKVRLFGRSKCISCEKKISFIDLIPIFGYLLIKGKCRNCNYKIPSIYFFAELLIPIICLIFINEYKNDLVVQINSLLIFALILTLYCISIIDYLTYKIPFLLVIIIFIIAFSFSIINNTFDILSILNFFIFYFALSLVNIIYKLIKGIIGIGNGDIQLIACLSLFFDFQFIILQILFSCLFGILFILVIFFFEKGNLKKKIPFAPFISISHLLLLYVQQKT